MGRYYNGDIEGKFWFALQPSNAPSRFGGEELTPSYITYVFNQEHLQGVNDEIESIEERLGDKKKIIDDFFAKTSAYNDDDLQEIGIDKFDLGEYADLLLGIQIRDCVIENDECVFDAEL
jgi:L-rhamnose isomerase